MRRLKRSRALHVTSLMATASFSLAACGAPQVAVPEPEPALAYTSLDECKAANDVTDAECDAADANAATTGRAKPRPATPPSRNAKASGGRTSAEPEHSRAAAPSSRRC